MERVAILGPGGAGKSVLAGELSRRTGLPVVYLDHLFWRAGWEPAPRERARRELQDVVASDRWIVDGNFLPEPGDRDDRFDRADTVIFLDLPRRTCLRRVLWRVARDRGRRRPDLPEGAGEGFDIDLLRWIWRYPKADRPRVLTLLDSVSERADVHHLRSSADVEAFLKTV